MPTIEWHYAVKANGDAKLLETLAQEGAGFDVATYSEFQKVHAVLRRLGFSLEDVRDASEDLRGVKSTVAARSLGVLHSHPCKSLSDIDACYKAG